MNKAASVRTFVLLIVVFGVLAGVSIFLPGGAASSPMQTAPLPAPLPVVALASGALVLVVYGTLGLLGLFLARKIGLPEIWDAAVTNRQRFLIPALAGVAVAVVLIAGDLFFSRINGIGHFPHPPFPTSIVAAITAGIGEETLFRLFFISFWTWLGSKVILRGRFLNVVYWVFSVLSAVAFGMSHLPAIMFLQNWTSVAQVPPLLLVEILLLNGILSLVAAYYYKRSGFLAPVGVHLWADMVWHVLWGML
jgi:hypothetical protein